MRNTNLVANAIPNLVANLVPNLIDIPGQRVASLDKAGDKVRDKVGDKVWLRPAVAMRGSLVTLTIASVALAIHLLPGLSAALQFERLAIANGQWWRILTGHLTHWNADHIFWDLLMFIILGVMVEQLGRLRLVLLCLTSAAGISLVIWCTQPDLPTYRGLSGVDTALFVYLACSLLTTARQARRWSGCVFPAVLLAGFAAKVIYEVVAGTTLFVDSQRAGFVVVAMAHLTGALIGVAMGWSLKSFRHEPRGRIQATPNACSSLPHGAR
jgi:rhomboid family GlyGly-CTERM serine protease